MESDYLKEIHTILDIAAKNLGERTLDNGTRLVGHIPHVAEEARLHLVFAPLTSQDIDYIENQLGLGIPNDLRMFYSYHNGLSLFSGSLSIDGLRRNYNRTGDDVWQPFDILVANKFESPDDLSNSCFLIGGYRQDGSRLYIDSKTSRVFRSARATSKPLNEWSSFEEMLLKETRRLDKLFDKDGKRKDSSFPTIPTAFDKGQFLN